MSVCPARQFHQFRFGLILALLLIAYHAPAPETDNFYLPSEPEFADFGEFLEGLHTRAIEEAVREVNGKIERALNLNNAAARTNQLARLHSPDALASAVASRFGNAMTEIFKINHYLGGAKAREAFPRKELTHLNISMNFCGHFPLDPRALVVLGQAGTVRAFGTYLGTDKILHFHQLGYDYYLRYRKLLRKGETPDHALQNVVRHFAHNGFVAEAHVYGTLLTGVYSNADLAADYSGLKFFLNLTEKVRLQGEEREPLVVRSGSFWRVNAQVRPRSGWFRYFISDHWNEALNPSLFDWTMRPFMRNILRRRAGPIIEFYTGRDGRPNNPRYFDDLAHNLESYYGEPYGHSGAFEKLMTIGNTCFPALKRAVGDAPAR